MAVMAIYRSAGVNRAQYDAVIEELDSKRTAPVGSLAHFAGFTGPDTIVVFDVWESQAHLETFGERLAPILKRHGVPDQTPEVIELHGVISYPALDAYKAALAPA